MAWVKTDAGRLEMQTRALVHGRPQRNLLLLVDGRKSEEQLLASVVGITAADLLALRDLGLIASPDHPPAAPALVSSTSGAEAATPPPAVDPTLRVMPASPPEALGGVPLPNPAPVSAAAVDAPIDIPIEPPAAGPRPSFDQISKTLTSLIASELGLRGFTLTLAVERASGIDALLDVADRVVAQIEHRKGPAAADKARRALFGR